MPSSNIQRAIDRVADKSAAALEEIAYEGYGPGGVGVIIERRQISQSNIARGKNCVG